MKPSSAKAKGRKLQNFIRDLILTFFPKLEADDVISTSMGAPGMDIKLSPAAGKVFPYAVEAKSLAKIAVYSYYEQASANKGKYEPLVIIQANNKPKLAIVDLDHFMTLVKNAGST